MIVEICLRLRTDYFFDFDATSYLNSNRIRQKIVSLREENKNEPR